MENTFACNRDLKGTAHRFQVKLKLFIPFPSILVFWNPTTSDRRPACCSPGNLKNESETEKGVESQLLALSSLTTIYCNLSLSQFSLCWIPFIFFRLNDCVARRMSHFDVVLNHDIGLKLHWHRIKPLKSFYNVNRLNRIISLKSFSNVDLWSPINCLGNCATICSFT